MGANISGGRCGRLLFIAAALAFALGEKAALAEEIPTVSLSAAGPNKEMPTAGSFYLSGVPSETATAVQVAIVRKGSSFIFGGSGPSCSKLAVELNIERAALLTLDSGVRPAADQFPAATDEQKKATLLLSSLWKRPASGDDETYKVLVPAEDAFFSPGYSYCLYVLEQSQKVDKTSLRELLGKAVGALEQCEHHAVVGAAPGAPGNLGDCKQKVLQDFGSSVDALLEKSKLGSVPNQAPLPQCTARKPVSDRDKAYCAMQERVTRALGPAKTVIQKQAALASSTAQTTVFVPRGWLPATTAVLQQRKDGGAPAASIAEAELGLVIATLLTSQGGLFPARNATLQHITPDGKIAVSWVSILDDDKRIRVASSDHPNANEIRILGDVTTQMLMVTNDVSLYDLLLLNRAIMRIDKDKTISFADLLAKVRRITLTQPWPTPDGLDVKAFASRLSSMVEATTPPNGTVDEETPSAVRAHVSKWYAVSNAHSAQIQVFDNNIHTLVEQKAKYDDIAKELQVVAAEWVELRSPQPIRFKIAFNQETWVFSYLTPTIGYAQIHGHERWFSQLYLAVQLHLFPNPVNEPLWQDGFVRDLPRMFALEFGFAPGLTGSFGPDDRYRGVYGLPTPFVGIAVHPLPYASLTLGEALLERRTTVLAAEAPHWAPRFFVGLNVQINIPDLIRKQKTSASVEGSPKK